MTWHVDVEHQKDYYSGIILVCFGKSVMRYVVLPISTRIVAARPQIYQNLVAA